MYEKCSGGDCASIARGIIKNRTRTFSNIIFSDLGNPKSFGYRIHTKMSLNASFTPKGSLKVHVSPSESFKEKMANHYKYFELWQPELRKHAHTQSIEIGVLAIPPACVRCHCWQKESGYRWMVHGFPWTSPDYRDRCLCNLKSTTNYEIRCTIVKLASMNFEIPFSPKMRIAKTRIFFTN